MHDTRFVRPFAALAAAIFALQLPAAAMAATPAAAPPTMDDAIAAIEAYAPAAMAYQGTPGLSVAITDRGKTVKIITLGYANVDAKAPVTPDTRFAIGSITKSMTALALMQLHDAGKLDFNATVQHYLPWFSIDSGGKPILVHQILSHSAGIPDDYSSESGSVYDVVALQKAKVLFPPGTAWSYSNDGIATAGAILTRLDGRTWPQSLQARVFDALGMSASFPVFTPEIMETAAVGYQWRDNDRPGALHPPLVASPPIDFVDPAGSVLSTPEDMAQYIRFYLNGGKTASGKQLVSPATFAQMTTADKYNNGKPAGDPNAELAEAPTYYKQYGFGLSIFDENGDHLIGHTGGISGLYRMHAGQPHARIRRDRDGESRRGAAASVRDHAVCDGRASRPKRGQTAAARTRDSGSARHQKRGSVRGNVHLARRKSVESRGRRHEPLARRRRGDDRALPAR